MGLFCLRTEATWCALRYIALTVYSVEPYDKNISGIAVPRLFPGIGIPKANASVGVISIWSITGDCDGHAWLKTESIIHRWKLACKRGTAAAVLKCLLHLCTYFIY